MTDTLHITKKTEAHDSAASPAIVRPASTRGGKIFAATCVVSALTFVAACSLEYAANRFAGRFTESGLQAARRLQPWNSDYPEMLGRLHFAQQMLPAAVADLQRSVALNPHIADAWFELANTYAAVGRSDEERLAIAKAIEANPTSPDVAWQAANFYLAQGDKARAFTHFRVFLAGSAGDGSYAISLCWRVTHDAATMIDRVLPPRVDRHLTFLAVLVSLNELEAAKQAWRGVIALHQPFEPWRAFPFIDALIAKGDARAAAEAWSDIASAAADFSGHVPREQLIVNGGFDENILNGGLDWRYRDVDSVSTSLDPVQFHGGFRSLQVNFEGGAVTDVGFFQIVPVEPNTRYELSVYYKTADLSGAGGPALVVAAEPGAELSTMELESVGHWQALAGRFTTAPTTHFVRVSLARRPAGEAIKGRLWLDDVRLAHQ